MSSFLCVGGDSNVDENTWWHHTCLRFSMSKVIWMLMRIPEDIIYVLASLCRRWFKCRWEYLKTLYMSSDPYVEGDSNVDENTWRNHSCPRFSMSKVIRMSMWIPEDIVHVLAALCRRLFECQWEYLKTSYMSSHLYVEGDFPIIFPFNEFHPLHIYTESPNTITEHHCFLKIMH